MTPTTEERLEAIESFCTKFALIGSKCMHENAIYGYMLASMCNTFGITKEQYHQMYARCEELAAEDLLDMFKESMQAGDDPVLNALLHRIKDSMRNGQSEH